MTKFDVKEVNNENSMHGKQNIFVSSHSILYIWLPYSSKTGFDVENKLLITVIFLYDDIKSGYI